MLNRKIFFIILLFVLAASFTYLFSKKSTPQDEVNTALPLEIQHSPSGKDGKGTAVVTPGSAVEVNSWGSWKIIYTVGEEGIAAGGGIAVHISPYWGWTAPQNSNQDYPGYTTVSTSNAKATLDVLTGSPHYIVIRTKEVPLTHKQSITVIYGDTDEGTHPLGKAKCDKYAEDGEDFFIKADVDGDGHFYPIENQPRINILPAPAAALAVTAPSLVKAETPFIITIAAVDHYDNWVKGYLGTITLSSLSSSVDILQEYHFEQSDRGVKRLKCIIKETGLFRIKVEDKRNGFKTESNPVLCTDGPLEHHLYWGDIHGHSNLCDGTGSPDNYYQYAREVAGLDVSALTTHDAHGFIPLDEDRETWELIRQKTDSYYRPGEFVTFLGYEWTNWTYGHQHVLFLNSKEGEVFSFRDPKSATPNKLWEALRGKEAITIPHHVGGGPIPYDWNYYNADFQPLTEICSVHGNNEAMGSFRGIYSPKEKHFVQDALARGYKLGIIASGDSHNGHPGRKGEGALTGGLLGIYAKALNRESIWKAFKERSVYATSGSRIILSFHINGHPMGKVVYLKDESEARDISGEVIGNDEMREVVIIKNGFTLHTIPGQGIKSTIHYLDESVLKEGDYYYLRAIQKNGEMAWSSPIWVEYKKGE
jgi:hypothetical protein